MYSRLKRVPTLKGDLVGQTARLPVPLGMPGLCLVVGTSDQGWWRVEGLHQRYSHLLAPASMALEERPPSLNMTNDKWGEITITSRKLIKLPGKYECK